MHTFPCKIKKGRANGKKAFVLAYERKMNHVPVIIHLTVIIIHRNPIKTS
jgi:hypothetical protein